MPQTKQPTAAFLLLAGLMTLSLSSPSAALEKTAARAVDDDRAWQAGSSVSVAYYNLCNGWVWIWEGWEPNDIIGVAYDFVWATELNSNWWYFGTGAPAGYGFTGTIEVNFVDNNYCPVHVPLASQSFLPVTGWNAVVWSPGVYVGSSRFSVTLEFGSGVANPAAAWTDHPAAGPTGPQACGTCYPSPRENHSFYFGTETSPLCPGSPLNDGVCDAQFIQDAQFTSIVAVDEQSWSSVKSLYR